MLLGKIMFGLDGWMDSTLGDTLGFLHQNTVCGLCCPRLAIGLTSNFQINKTYIKITEVFVLPEVHTKLSPLSQGSVPLTNKNGVQYLLMPPPQTLKLQKSKCKEVSCPFFCHLFS